jgi:hypothetical protein
MNRFTPQGRVKEVNASVISPQNAGLRLIVNVVGQDGKFDSKLDTLLTKQYPKLKSDFREWYATQHDFKPGLLNTTALASDCWGVSMLVKDKTGKVDLKALQAGVKKLAVLAKYEQASVHISNILVQEIPELKDLVLEQVAGNGINCYFYTEPTKE